MGTAAVILGICSWIMLPIVFGPLAIIFGALDAKTTSGQFGIVFGVTSLIIILF